MQTPTITHENPDISKDAPPLRCAHDPAADKYRAELDTRDDTGRRWHIWERLHVTPVQPFTDSGGNERNAIACWGVYAVTWNEDAAHAIAAAMNIWNAAADAN